MASRKKKKAVRRAVAKKRPNPKSIVKPLKIEFDPTSGEFCLFCKSGTKHAEVTDIGMLASVSPSAVRTNVEVVFDPTSGEYHIFKK